LKIIFLGAPGAGKGTQAEIVSGPQSIMVSPSKRAALRQRFSRGSGLRSALRQASQPHMGLGNISDAPVPKKSIRSSSFHLRSMVS
jgi:hypothetical protein